MSRVAAGTILVSRPALSDPNFRRSVVLVMQHDPTGGTLGLVVNRPSPAKLADVVEKVDGVSGRDDVLWYGGPCKPAAVWVVHRRDDADERGSEVSKGVFVGGSPTLLSELLKTSEGNPSPHLFRVVRGYAGWGPGQLSREIQEGAWRTAEAEPDVLFGDESDSLWDDVLLRSQLPMRLPADTLRRARLN
jgi:putative transcriptional regulator